MTSWLPNWSYRKSHLITASAGAGTGFQVKITVHYGAGTSTGDNVYCNSLCKTDFGDIRFTDNDGSTELSYWMQSKVDSDNAIFWVKVNDTLESNATIYMYYGKSDATTTSDIDATFIDVINGTLPTQLALPCREGTGSTVYDKSGNGKDGTISGASWSSGDLSFDGTNDKVTIGDILAFPAAGSIVVWLKAPLKDYGNSFFILSTSTDYASTNGIRFQIYANGYANVVVNGVSTHHNNPSPDPFPNDTWVMLTIMWDTAQNKIWSYENATIKINGVAITSWPTGTYTVLGLGFADTAARYWGGLIKHFRVFNRLLTATEIANMYNNLPCEV